MIRFGAKKITAACMALLLVMTMPFAGLAQDQTQGRMHFGGRMPFVDESTLTTDQQAAYAQAKADYEAIEDQQLANLVAAGTIAQADVDVYIQQRTEGGQMPSGGQTPQRIEMTDDQRNAIMQAMQSDNRDQAVADLVSQGVITQEQADRLSPIQQRNGQGVGGGNLWARIQRVSETDTAASIAVNNIQVATQNMRQALTNAGIQTPQLDQMPDAAAAP